MTESRLGNAATLDMKNKRHNAAAAANDGKQLLRERLQSAGLNEAFECSL